MGETHFTYFQLKMIPCAYHVLLHAGRGFEKLKLNESRRQKLERQNYWQHAKPNITTSATLKKDILVVQGDWNAKVGKDAYGNWQRI